MIDGDEWHPPSSAVMPVGPQSFPDAGVNSLAPIGLRAAARAIDWALISIPSFVVFTIAALTTVGLDADAEAMAADVTLALWFTASAFLFGFVYETVCLTLWGQTLGKLVLGLRVARQANGRCPLWWEAGIRVALPGVVSAVPHPAAPVGALVLYVAASFDPMRRTVPDRAAGTVVVRSR